MKSKSNDGVRYIHGRQFITIARPQKCHVCKKPGLEFTYDYQSYSQRFKMTCPDCFESVVNEVNTALGKKPEA